MAPYQATAELVDSLAHTHPRASFSIVEYFLSAWVSVRDAKATVFSEPS